MKASLILLLIISFISCNKSSKSEDLKTISIALVNPYWDSIYVTTTNHTHSQLSVGRTGVAGKTKTGSEPHLAIKAVDNDTMTFQYVLRPSNKLGRHPLFMKEFAYTVGRRAPYRGTPFFNYAPSGSFIEIKTQNSSNKYVTAMLVHNGREDSLFTLEPQSATTEFQTVGYFKVADTISIKRPFIKFYFGQTPPFTNTMSSLPLWGEGAVNTASSAEPYSQGSSFFVPIKQ